MVVKAYSHAQASDFDNTAGLIVSGLVALGGVVGFLRAGSVPSLVAGLGSGLALAYGVTRATARYKDVTVVLAVSAVLLFIMGKKFLRTRKIMPAGLVTFLSIFMLYRFGSRLL